MYPQYNLHFHSRLLRSHATGTASPGSNLKSEICRQIAECSKNVTTHKDRNCAICNLRANCTPCQSTVFCKGTWAEIWFSCILTRRLHSPPCLLAHSSQSAICKLKPGAPEICPLRRSQSAICPENRILLSPSCKIDFCDDRLNTHDCHQDRWQVILSQHGRLQIADCRFPRR